MKNLPSIYFVSNIIAAYAVLKSNCTVYCHNKRWQLIVCNTDIKNVSEPRGASPDN